MSKIIIDLGSGNTCKNDFEYAKRMIDELKAVDTGKHEVILKWQLFLKAGGNVPLYPAVFSKAYHYAAKLGYKTTASVFGLKSLLFLLGFDIPFVKIANIRALDWLVGEVPRKVPIYISVATQVDYIDMESKINEKIDEIMCCVSKYPAELDDYEIAHNRLDMMCKNISDHTTDFELFYKYKPHIIEWHYKLSNSTGLDAGAFSRTPEQLREVLG
jgi:sialic acid synthase SpsE